MQQVDDEGPENYKVELIDTKTDQVVSQDPQQTESQTELVVSQKHEKKA